MKSYLKKILYGGGVFFELAKGAIVALIVLTTISVFWVTLFVVDGLSMEPNLHDKELVLLKKNAYQKNDPRRGEIVVVQYPGDPSHKRYVKRVIGLPGEKIETRGGKVYLNGALLKELYIPYGVESEPEVSRLLSSGEYFLMGDNRPNSNDSRFFGGVEKRFIVGKAIYIVFPRIRLLMEG